MDQDTKQRLVGLTVIFALAVIFLPMILDGSGIRQNTLEIEIPPQPVSSFKPEFEQKIVELDAEVEEIPTLEPRVADEDSSNNTITRDDGEDSGESGTVMEADPETNESLVTEDTVAGTGGDTWVLQVASFKDKPKALAQRDKLRKSNIATVFVEQFKIDDQVIYRVRLGPFVDRDKAKVALNKLKAKHDINGLVMQYEK